MLDWNDLRYFLAVAARRKHACSRPRIAGQPDDGCAPRSPRSSRRSAFQLFEKRQAGYALTPAGQELLQQGRAGREHPRMLRRSGRGAGPARSRGTVRITTEEVYAITLLAPLLRELHEQLSRDPDRARHQPAVRDLGAGEADIALRAARRRATSGAGRPSALHRRLDALLQPRLCRAPRRARRPSPS